VGEAKVKEKVEFEVSTPPRFMSPPKNQKAAVGEDFTSALPLIFYQNGKTEVIVTIFNRDEIPESVSLVKINGVYNLEIKDAKEKDVGKHKLIYSLKASKKDSNKFLTSEASQELEITIA
jgi:hypothetical protein